MKKYPLWKALMDYGVSLIALLVLGPILIILIILASVDTGGFGVFTQKRIGRNGVPFVIYKFRTYDIKNTQKTKMGKWLRKTKMDELLQLINIIKGDMSLVGPRPDLPGYYDKLEGEDRLILQLKPGITSEAGIKYRNEEELLNRQENPLKYNDEVIFPDKVKMNLEYYYNLSFKRDILIMWKTFSVFV
ncbi:sugar transferase [Chryseobacterium sp. CT-SW4]|uniref:sugar transferase n=1 Tax=Chryseobacterium sp. SW-1 TaxID=3157343 RepID=UPI003B02A157